MSAITLARTTTGKGLRVGLAALLVAGGFAVAATQRAEAAALTSLSLTMSKTTSGATAAVHTFDFTKGTTGDTLAIKFQYCTTASGPCTTPTGLDTTSAAINTAGTDTEFDLWDIDVASNGTILISDATGDNTNASPTIAFEAITNVGTTNDTSATVFFVRVTTYSDEAATTSVDTGQVASAVIPSITASGTQDAILEFTVNGVDASESVNETTTTSASEATTLPFGNFKPLNTSGEESRRVAHTIDVVTNAEAGYSASVTGESGALTRDGGTETVGWVGSNHTWNESTSQGLGIRATASGTATSANSAFNSNQYQPADSTLSLASSTAPTDDSEITVVYRVQVPATLAAGQYNGTITYSVLPNY